MKKLAISTIALSALSATSAHAVEFEPAEGASVSFYGAFEPSFKSVTNADGDGETDYGDEGSIIGFSGEYRINSSISVFGTAEFEFLSDDSDPSFVFDEGWFGFKGEQWGRIKAGGFDSVYEDLIVDTTEIAEIAEISDESLAPEDNLVAYYSPVWNGFSFRTQARVIGDGDDEAVRDQDSTEIGVAAAGGYSAEQWSLHVGFDDLATNVARTETVKTEATLANGNTITTGSKQVNAEFVDGETYGVAGDVRFGAVGLGAKWAESQFDNAEDVTRTALRGNVGYGKGKLYAAVQSVEPDTSEDRTEFTVGVDYKPLPNLKIFSEAGWFERSNDEGDVVGVGAIFEF